MDAQQGKGGGSLTALRGRAAALQGLRLPTRSEKGTLLLPHREAGAAWSGPDSELHGLLMRHERRQKLQERGESAGLAAEQVRGHLLSGLSSSSDCAPPAPTPPNPAGLEEPGFMTSPPGVAGSGRSSESLATMLCPLNIPARHTAITKSSVCLKLRAAPTTHGTENHRPRAGAAASLVTGNQAEATKTSPWPREAHPGCLGVTLCRPPPTPAPGRRVLGRGPLALLICIPHDCSWDSLSQGSHWTPVSVQSALLLSLCLPGAACGGRWRARLDLRATASTQAWAEQLEPFRRMHHLRQNQAFCGGYKD